MDRLDEWMDGRMNEWTGRQSNYRMTYQLMNTLLQPEGLTRAGDWRPHLAMMITNMTSQQDTSCIISLGDSLCKLSIAYVIVFKGLKIEMFRYGRNILIAYC